MKKLFSVLLTLALVLSLCVPALAEGLHQIVGKEFPVYYTNVDLGETMKLYFLDGVDDLPWVELGDWKDLLGFVYLQGGSSDYELSLSTAGPVACYTRENGLTMVIDFDEDIFRFVDYNLFVRFSEMSTLLDLNAGRCFNDAGEPSLFKKSEEFSYDRYGDELVVRLGDYGIDIVHQDGLYLVPLQTMADITLAPCTLLNTFFNGQCLILAGGLTPDDDIYYAAPTGTRSEALAKYGYSELCLALDCLYGLKEVHGIDSFAQLFHQVGFDAPLSGTNAATADKALMVFIFQYLDDIHSNFSAFSYLTGSIDYVTNPGPSILSYFDHLRTYSTARDEKYPDGVPAYEEVGNTAYITFDSFAKQAASYEDYYGYENVKDIPFDDSDTIAMIVRAHDQITRENSPIENVVIDLSCNGGGTVDTACYLIAWCLGKASISIKDTFTGAMANTDYWADVNLDRVFDEKDTIADKNIYCLISPLSFSCGNLVPNVFKQSGKVTLMGRTSGGGSCVVQSLSSAWGTSFDISAPRRLSFMKNGSLYDIDRGADPDYTISQPAKYYDREALTGYINTLY